MISRFLTCVTVAMCVLPPAAGCIELARSRESPPNPRCSAAEYHQLDFWIGDWDAFDVGGAKVSAHVRVERTLQGCALREIYEGVDGEHGESLSAYDASRGVWQQSWFTNRGYMLTIEGHLTSDGLVLEGVEQTADGRTLVRGIWRAVNGGVRETAVTSSDDGKKWKPWFDLMFRPHHR